MTKTSTSTTAPKPTKLDRIRELLAAKRGATLAQLCESTGWQTHSVRAALTGLRKQGHEVERTKSDDGTTTYRILVRKETKG